jgi:hypothetical protein
LRPIRPCVNAKPPRPTKFLSNRVGTSTRKARTVRCVEFIGESEKFTGSQAIGTVAAVVAAVVYPLWRERKTHEKTRMAHLETVAMDIRLADRQAQVYLDVGVDVPAYRLSLFGPQHAMPALLAEGKLTTDQAKALVQYYTDAVSFNRCLDLAQQHLAANADPGKLGRIKARRLLEREVCRARRKANHLVQGTPESRLDQAIKALRQAGVTEKALAQIPAHILVGDDG